MIKTEIERLVSLLQAMTLQKMEASRNGRQREVLQIQSVQVDIDNKIQELEKQLAWSNLFFKLSCVATIMLAFQKVEHGSGSISGAWSLLKTLQEIVKTSEKQLYGVKITSGCFPTTI